MICPITNRPCTTNGCGDKCYKKDSLGYSAMPNMQTIRTIADMFNQPTRTMSNNANKPINPAPYVIREDGSISNPTYAGLTKREYFAGLAMNELNIGDPRARIRDLREVMEIKDRLTHGRVKEYFI